MIGEIDAKDKWLLQRKGMFTASVCSKLWKTGKDGTGFSQTGLTYIEEKAIESCTEWWEAPELEFVESLLYGKMYEEPAFNEYLRVTKNYQMKYHGTENPQFISYNDYSGGSPDALMTGWGAEIKCPKTPKKHYQYLKYKDQWDIKMNSFEYYCQMQMLFLCTKVDGFHFVSFDERWTDPKLRIKIIEVLPDKKFQDNLEIRLQLAQKEKLKMIQELKSM